MAKKIGFVIENSSMNEVHLLMQCVLPDFWTEKIGCPRALQSSYYSQSTTALANTHAVKSHGH